MEELVLWLVSLVGGAVFGSVVFVLVRLARMALLRVDRGKEVVDPTGAPWLVAIPVVPRRLHVPLSRAAFGMGWDARRRRRRAGVADDGIADDEMAHPKGMAAETDDLAGCVAPILLVVVSVGLALLAVELLAAAILAALVGAYRLIRATWVVVVTDPRQRAASFPADSLRHARMLATDLAADIAAGRYESWNH